MAGIAASAFVAVEPPPAHAQGLFDLLFGNAARQRAKPQAVVPVEKVSAPKYFDYRPAAFEAVDFSALADSAAAADTMPRPDIYAIDDVRRIQHMLAQVGDYAPRFEKAIGAAVAGYYADGGKLLWIGEAGPTDEARRVMSVFRSADEYGLAPADYVVNGPGSGAATRELVRFELAMSLHGVRYMLDAHNGRIDPNLLSGYHDFPGKGFGAGEALAALAASDNRAGDLIAAHPPQPQFGDLVAELARLRELTDDTISIAEGTLVKPGMEHAELPNIVAAIRRRGSIQLLQRHGETLTAYSRTPHYTEGLVSLVKDFQTEKGLVSDGIVGRNTIGKLVGVSPRVKMVRVRYAMERLRWHPRALGDRHVFINQPAYQARYIEGDDEKLKMRVIVGKRSNQTSFFHDEIERVEYNPYWGVPRSIIVNEMLPHLRADPSYLDAKGYEITDRRGRRVSSINVDWMSVGTTEIGYDVRQPPGPANALGELKIMFPNKHAIYMHDTPARQLFGQSRRAFSHGCIRLQHPRKMAAAVLGTTVGHIGAMIEEGHSSEHLKEKVPVYVAYFTAWPNRDGEIEYFADMYDRDAHLRKAMGIVAKARRG